MARKSKKSVSHKQEKGGKIVIDASQGLVFADEEELFNYFSRDIETLEKKFFALRRDTDIPVEDFSNYEDFLSKLLADPEEIWLDRNSLEGKVVNNFIGTYEDIEKRFLEPVFYVAQVYMANDTPSFVYLHFPTKDEDLADKYRTGEMIYDRSKKGTFLGASDGDALSEKEPLAEGLYQAMIKVRSENDIKEEEFPKFFNLREETIEEPDEIWRSRDAYGIILVNFIKEFSNPEEGEDSNMYYIAVTQEDPATDSHMLLFSFPTRDKSLVERYRHGENMTADEVIQESSH